MTEKDPMELLLQFDIEYLYHMYRIAGAYDPERQLE